MKDQRLIFVSNDDGYDAKGIAALVEVASKFGRVVVVAPRTAQSGMSQAITMYSPLYPERIDSPLDAEIYSLNGTPVDCVKFGLDHLLKDQKVDLVLSGINHGSNSAINVLYSGTMGAAIEGAFYAPAIGFSLLNHSSDADFSVAKIYVERVIEAMLASPMEHYCLNVNIPDLAADQIKGIKYCRQNRGFWREEFFQRQDPRGKEYFWLTGAFINEEKESTDTDEWALENGYVSVVPIQVDMTNYKAMNELQQIKM